MLQLQITSMEGVSNIYQSVQFIYICTYIYNLYKWHGGVLGNVAAFQI